MPGPKGIRATWANHGEDRTTPTALRAPCLRAQGRGRMHIPGLCPLSAGLSADGPDVATVSAREPKTRDRGLGGRTWKVRAFQEATAHAAQGKCQNQVKAVARSLRRREESQNRETLLILTGLNCGEGLEGRGSFRSPNWSLRRSLKFRDTSSNLMRRGWELTGAVAGLAGATGHGLFSQEFHTSWGTEGHSPG